MRVFMFRSLVTGLACVLLNFTAQAQQEHYEKQDSRQSNKTGILLLAHGGDSNWNDEVNKLVQKTDKTFPTEVAFGMATKSTMEAAIHRLVARGVSEVVAVPLFISPHSSIVTSSQYLLGHISEPPSELAIFAKMSHGHGGADHSAHPSDSTKPIDLPVPVRITEALGRHPLIAQILLARAQSISQNVVEEAVVLVAHGPVSDEENEKWLADMASLAQQMNRSSKFRDIRFMTVRDDAPAPIRNQATAELRHLIESLRKENRRVLVVPLLLSYGGIERGIKKRLDGLDYTLADQALLPDERLAEWVLTVTRKALRQTKPSHK